MIEALFSELARLPQVEAIALGGSRAGDVYDEKSDYDVYLYCKEAVEVEVRRAILEKYCRYMELGNQFWEYEDNCTLNNGIDIDILYRNLDDFVQGVASVVEEGQAHNGYTTCMWHNLQTCKIIYDPDGRLTKAKERFAVPYPQRLKKAIVERNLKLLRGTLPAYDTQIKKAVMRGDIVSINHRTAAFMESYFDIIFALNELTHPGEKRLLQLSRERCKLLPKDYETNVETLFRDLYTNTEKVDEDIRTLVSELEWIIAEESL